MAARLEELGQVLKDRRDPVLAALKHEREVSQAIVLFGWGKDVGKRIGRRMEHEFLGL